MHLLAGEIQSLLANHDYGYPVSVVRGFSADVKTFPRVVIHQVTDSSLIRTVDGDKVCALAFQIDIYTTDFESADGRVLSRGEISDDIANQVDALIYDRYKMSRDEVTDIFEYTVDVARRVIRYSCAIQDGYTYRTASASLGGYSYQNRFD